MLKLVYLVIGSEVYQFGGREKYVRELNNYLVSRGYRVKILWRMGKTYTNIDEVSTNFHFRNTLVLHPEGSYSIYMLMQHLPNPLSVFFGVIKLVRDIRYEGNCYKILHAHDVSSSLLIALIMKKFFKLPFIVQIHGFPLKEQKIKLLKSNCLLSSLVWFLTKMWHVVAVRSVKSHATLVLVNNNEIKSFYESYGIPSEKLEISPSGINLRDFRKNLLPEEEARKCLGLPNSKKMVTIGFVGRLNPEKNVEILVKAFREFVKSYTEAKALLIIIGDGPMRPILEEYVKISCISDRTFFLGYIRDANRFLNAIDIFVLPSLSEGSPFSLLEAMAGGKAIIASDIPAIKEIVENGKEAILFNPHNPQQLKNLMLTLYNNPELRNKLAENARRKAEQYDANVIFPKILLIYRKILTSSAGSN